jgi:hypothetical protein
MDKPKSALRTLLPVDAGLCRLHREASFVNRFDAGPSIKVECANVKVLDDVSIFIVFSWLQAVLLPACPRLFPIQNNFWRVFASYCPA